jgi:hypothetical protein
MHALSLLCMIFVKDFIIAIAVSTKHLDDLQV